jgi:hypothetical protein
VSVVPKVFNNVFLFIGSTASLLKKGTGEKFESNGNTFAKKM